MPLAEGEWNLSYEPYGILPGADFTFGTRRSGYDLLEPYEITYADADVGDTPMPRTDAVRLGQDFKAAATITFEIGVDTVGAAKTQVGRHGANLDAVSVGSQAWDAEALRRRFGVPAVLRTVQGPCAPVLRAASQVGAGRFPAHPARPHLRGCQLCMRGRALVRRPGAEQDRPAATPDHRGLTGPLKAPITMTGESSSVLPGGLTVGGTKPTWPVITIYGPISQPECVLVDRALDDRDPNKGFLPGWTVGLDLGIEEGRPSPSTPGRGHAPSCATARPPSPATSHGAPRGWRTCGYRSAVRT